MIGGHHDSVLLCKGFLRVIRRPKKFRNNVTISLALILLKKNSFFFSAASTLLQDAKFKLPFKRKSKRSDLSDL